MFGRIRFYLILLFAVSTVVQAVVFGDMANLLCCAMAFAGSTVTVAYVLQPKLIQRWPLSSVGILMYSAVNLMIPLVVANLEYRPMIRNLAIPIATFGYLTLGALTLIAAHRLYQGWKGLQRFRQLITTRLNAPTGMFNEPSDARLWFIGLIGMVCLFYIASVFKSDNSGGGAGQRIIQILIPFSYAPFLTVLRYLYTRDAPPVSGRKVAALSVYFVLVVVGALNRNTRNDFALPVAVITFCLVLAVLSYRLAAHRIKPKLVLSVVAIGAILYPFLAALAVSMVYTRIMYSKKSARQQVGLVISQMSDRDQLEEFLRKQAETQVAWSESYYDPSNVFLARFANVKYHDNCLVLAEMTPGQRAKMTQYLVNRVISILPGPIVSVLVPDLDKSEALAMSAGDYMFYLHYGRGLGTKRTGSIVGEGIAVFGVLFFPLFGAMMLVYFAIVDSFARRFVQVRLAKTEADGPLRPVRLLSTPVFAPIILLNIFTVLDPYRYDSSADILLFMTRGLFQQILIYWALMFFADRVEGIVRAALPKRRRPIPPSQPYGPPEARPLMRRN